MGKLSQLWRSLADYQKAKTMEEVRKELEEDKLHQFLMGLDETLYGAVKSSLLSRVPLSTVEEAYNTLIQDEESKLLGRMNEERTDTVSFVVQAGSRSRPSNENMGFSENKVCSNCGCKGHTSENCFRLIGYPEWYEEKHKNKLGSSRGNLNSGAGRGSNMQGGVSQGRGNGAGRSSAQASHVFADGASSSPSLTSADRMGISGLSDSQWKTLVHMLEERKTTPMEHRSGKQFLESWIFDSGATNHMTGCYEYLSEVGDMAPVLIKLPDGRFTTSTKHGYVRLGSSLSLHEVFFVYGLHCHLISVS